MKAFITGATGFIGGHLARTLLARGDDVSCLIRSGSNISLLQKTAALLIEDDLLSPQNLVEHILSCDIVFHVAGVTKALHPKEYYDGNVLTTTNLLGILQLSQEKKPKLIYISSQAAAGPSASPHFSEDQVPSPTSEYGKSKLEAEKAILESRYDRNYTILRPSIVFGPHDYEMLPLFKAAKLGIIPQPGFDDFPVNFIYITDFIDAIMIAADHPEAPGKTYFVHDGQPSSWKIMNKHIKNEVNSRAIILPIARRILQLVCHISGLGAKIHGKATYMNRDKWLEIKQDGWLCSSAKFQKEMGFKSRWSLEKGVASTVMWYRNNNFL